MSILKLSTSYKKIYYFQRNIKLTELIFFPVYYCAQLDKKWFINTRFYKL